MLGKGFATFLLTGVTASGKTEVYLQLAAEAIEGGLPVLVLVPEIALISQMERRFRARFGDCVAVLHSGLSAGERYDQWQRILRGRATIAVGARSAIFAPFRRVGLVIVDEEHDSSYKQEQGLRYNARDLAVVRAKQDGAAALLGSATPSIQSYFNVCRQKFREITLTERFEQRPMPQIQVVDLGRTGDRRGARSYITDPLRVAMQQALDRGEQVMLFLNRRGFANYPVCAACGQALRCKNCDITLTLHQEANAYRCHYCGYSRAVTSDCPACGAARIKPLGLGTEKIEDAVQNLFPAARVSRMDRDTTARKGALLKILKDLRSRKIDVLVGTQMIAKGHDFPHITLVGIICADLSLNFPDFRAGERTFQVLAQVAGRAGRGAAPGKVILQTFNPNHFSIMCAQAQDFKSFYDQEIRYRQSLLYPPFARLIQLKISGRSESRTADHAAALGRACTDLKAARPATFEPVAVLGPLEAPLARIQSRYRWQILLKSTAARLLHQFVDRLATENPALFGRRRVKVAVDVDPYQMM